MKTIIDYTNALKGYFASNKAESNSTVVDYTPIVAVDDALPITAKALKVKVDEVQDLHGYPKPWVGGAGKNKLKLTLARLKVNNTSGTWNDNKYTWDNVVYTVLTDSDGNVTGISTNGVSSERRDFLLEYIDKFDLSNVILNGCPSGSTGSNYKLLIYDVNTAQQVDDTGNGVTIPASFSGHACRVVLTIYGGITTNNLVFLPMLRDSNESADFEPYTNICPISGWNNAKVTRSGKNLLIPETLTATKTANGVNITKNIDDTLTLSNTCTSNDTTWISGGNNNNRLKLHNGIYKVSLDNNSISHRMMGHRAQENDWVELVFGTGELTFTASSAYEYYLWQINLTNGTTYNATLKPMIRLASVTDATYEPYQGIETTISLNGTRYGGTLDVTSGVLTLTRGYKDLSTLTWTMYGSAGSQYFTSSGISDFKHVDSDAKADMICSCFEVVAQSNRQTNMAGTICEFSSNNPSDSSRSLLITSNLYEDANALTAALNGQTLVYELATPQIIQLTPTEVKLLQGYNTIWTDTGNTYLEYLTQSVGNIAEVVGENVASIDTMLNVLGAKNMFAGIFTASTINGVTYTVNSDGTVPAVGTVGNQYNYAQIQSSKFTLPKGDYIISYNPLPNGYEGTAITLYNYTKSAALGVMNDHEVLYSIDTDCECDLRLICYKTGNTYNTVFKPMIRPAGISNSDYVPYAKTNVELTQDLSTKAVSGYTWNASIDTTKNINVSRYGNIVFVYGFFNATTALPIYSDILTGLPHCALASLSADVKCNMNFILQGSGTSAKIVNQNPTVADTQYTFSFVYLTDAN